VQRLSDKQGCERPDRLKPAICKNDYVYATVSLDGWADKDLHMTLTLQQALAIAQTALAEGATQRFLPLAVAVLDTAGQPLAILRDERSSLHRADIAIGKAAGCLAMGFGGRELAKRAAAMPQFISAVGSIFPKGLVPVPGGVLIRDADGTLLGAVGISGDTSDNDEVCALAGIASVDLIADTGA
jgi:uncharacterized protein GlcG (DUF336 family)